MSFWTGFQRGFNRAVEAKPEREETLEEYQSKIKSTYGVDVISKEGTVILFSTDSIIQRSRNIAWLIGFRENAFYYKTYAEMVLSLERVLQAYKEQDDAPKNPNDERRSDDGCDSGGVH